AFLAAAQADRLGARAFGQARRRRARRPAGAVPARQSAAPGGPALGRARQGLARPGLRGRGARKRVTTVTFFLRGRVKGRERPRRRRVSSSLRGDLPLPAPTDKRSLLGGGARAAGLRRRRGEAPGRRTAAPAVAVRGGAEAVRGRGPARGPAIPSPSPFPQRLSTARDSWKRFARRSTGCRRSSARSSS